MRITPLLLFAITLAPLRIAAQPVTGIVVEEGMGTPLPGAMVLLFDGKGDQVARVLTDAAGRFLVHALDSSPHHIAVERIGYADWTTDPFTPDPAGTVLRIEVPVEAVSLERIDVYAGRRCAVRPDESAATARVWNEVRKALTAVEYTREAELYRYQLLRYERTLNRNASDTLSETARWSEYLPATFVSFPIENLAAQGFVQTDDSTATYYAPDAGALLSDVFLDTHCFGLREGEVGTIGLTFRPLPDRQVPEIGGVLWLKAATSELDRLEFQYLNLESDDVGEPGGEVAFTRLPTGAWIVRSWRIRMPHLEWLSMWRIMRTGYIEQGGVTRAVADSRGRTILHSEMASVSGVVTDSAGTGPPPEFVVVELLGTTEHAMTEDDGSFLLAGLPEGRHRLRVQRPLLANWGLFLPREVSVEARRGEVAHVSLRAPSVTDVLVASCGGTPRPAGTMAFLGRITTADGVPLDEMTVEARWLRASGYVVPAVAAPLGPEGVPDHRWTTGWDGAFATATTNTDWRGLFLLCDFPGGSRLRVSVSGPEGDGPVLTETYFLSPGAAAAVETLVVPETGTPRAQLRAGVWRPTEPT